MSAYVQRAKTALLDWFEAQLPTHLAAVETEEGLNAGDLTVPVEYMGRPAVHDNRSPLLQVYAESIDSGELRAGKWVITCPVVLSYSSDADLDAAELFVERYITALIRTVAADPQLGGQAVVTVLDRGEVHHYEGDNSATRHIAVLWFDVKLHEREV